MNRTLVFGIAIFFAVVGIALLGGDNAAVAGHGCHGCDGYAACDGGGCFGGWRHRRHHRRGGLFGRHRGGCCGEVQDCCAPEPTCCEPEPQCCEPQPTCCGSAGGAVYGGGEAYQGGHGEVGPPPMPEGANGGAEGGDAPPAPKEPSAKRTMERAPYVFRNASFRR
jgi:hypothetical protein